MNLLKHSFFVFLFFQLIGSFSASAQNHKRKQQTQDAYGYDSGYVVSFRDNFVLTVVNETKSTISAVSFIDKKNNVYSLDYRTNTINTWGLGFDYKWFTFEYTHKMPWYTPDPKYGEVKNSGFGFGITGRRLAFRNFYESSTGFYLENTEEWLKGYVQKNGEYYNRPDMHTFTYYANLNYVFNNKHFSNNASLWQLERQNKKAGTFVAGASYIFNSFSADSSIIPTTGIDSFPRSNNTFFALNSVGVNMGYMGTLPMGKRKKLFITTAIIPGISRQWGELTVENVGVAQASKLLGFQSEFRFGFGYNGDKWYVGSIFRAYSNLNAINANEPFSISNRYGRFYVGYRFNSPQIKNEKVNKVLRKLKL